MAPEGSLFISGEVTDKAGETFEAWSPLGSVSTGFLLRPTGLPWIVSLVFLLRLAGWSLLLGLTGLLLISTRWQWVVAHFLPWASGRYLLSCCLPKWALGASDFRFPLNTP